MPPLPVSLDLLNLLFLPLMVVTIIETKRNWAALTDSTLTPYDRYLLLRIVLFLLMPLVVFCHEMGHVAAIKYFGGTVKEFHYAFLWGYVVPAGHFTNAQLLICYLAGNAVQIAIGLVAFVFAIFATSPPVVALLVYLSIWAIAGTTILYALMSVTGLYGGWAAIYLAPVPQLVIPIAIVHTLLVAGILYGLYGTKPKIWFTGKTQMHWLESHKRYLAEVSLHPSAGNWLNLAASYQKAGLLRQAHQCVQKSLLTNPDLVSKARILLFEGSLFVRQGNVDKAANCYQQVASASQMPIEERLRAYYLLADLSERQNNMDAALSLYNQAVSVEPTLADAHYLKARLLLKLGRKAEAQSELKLCSELSFSDANFFEAYRQDVLEAEQG